MESNVLEDAIKDGVDIISISLLGGSMGYLHQDAIAFKLNVEIMKLKMKRRRKH